MNAYNSRSPRSVWLVLAAAYGGLCVLYLWQAHRQGTPWLFTDELENAQLARSIAEDGAIERRGEPHPFQSIYPFVIAPAWWLDEVGTAYAVTKVIGVLLMTAVIFPSYALARLVSGARAATVAAVTSAAVPALVYAPVLLEEVIAYPYGTLCLFVIARGAVTRRPTAFVPALPLVAVAPFVRGELIVLFGVLLVAAAAVLGKSAPFTRWRSGRQRRSVLLAAGAVTALVIAHVIASSVSDSWNAGSAEPVRLVRHGAWALAALAIGLGVLPVLAALVFWTSTALRGDRLGGFTLVSTAAVLLFVVYTGAKAAAIAGTLGARVEERNLVYLCPLVFAACAALLSLTLAR